MKTLTKSIRQTIPLLWVVFALLAFGCSPSFTSFTWNTEPISAKPDYYFDYEAFSKNENSSLDSANYYSLSQRLREAGEPSLYYDSTKVMAFRFIVETTWVGEEIIRVENEKGSIQLTYKQRFYGEPGTLDSIHPPVIRNLTQEEWNFISNNMEESHFWENPQQRKGFPSRCGGSSFIAEGYSDGVHQVVYESYFDAGKTQKVSDVIKYLRGSAEELKPLNFQARTPR